MKPDKFQYGLGPNAIPPINNPKFLSPGDKDYPSDNATFLVLGITIEGESRTYPMSVLGQHEVVNDWFGNTPVAVTN